MARSTTGGLHRYLSKRVLETRYISIFSEFGTMINPKVYKPPPKFSFRNLKKYMPQIKEMARKEGVARDQIKKEKKEGAHMILQFLTDD